MSTKFIPIEQRLKKVSPYPSPYDAYINYMNVLSDFILRVSAEYPSSMGDEELNALLQTIENQNKKIALLETQQTQ